MISVAKRIIRQVAGDKRIVMMIVFAPLLILTLLYFLLGDTTYKPTIAIHESKLHPALVSALKAEDAYIVDIREDVDSEHYLKDHRDVDAVFSLSEAGSGIDMYESSSKSAKAMKVIQNALASLNPSAKMTTTFVIGKENASFFESMGYIFFGLFAFFFIFLISGMSLVKERSIGTLERFMMSPISRSSAILGYTVGYGVFAVLQAIVMTLFGIYVLGIGCAGNIIWAILIMLLLAISAVSFGFLVSTFSNTELQVVQIIPVAIIPQVFFSGLIPLDTIPYGLGNLGYFTPVFYGCTAMKKIMVIGDDFGDIWPYLLGLLIYILVLCILNMLALKKYRRL
jgi:ABC-2 type transport system permease protein